LNWNNFSQYFSERLGAINTLFTKEEKKPEVTEGLIRENRDRLENQEISDKIQTEDHSNITPSDESEVPQE
jgi:hypothetical protein